MKRFLILFAAAVLLFGCNSAPVAPTGNTVPTGETPKNTALKSLKDLLSTGAAQKCTWSNEQGNQKISGTILIKDKKFRQDYLVTAAATTTQGHAISDGQNMYLWSDQNKTAGIKMKIDEVQPTGAQPASDNAQAKSVDLNKQMNYNCTAATISDADVTPPVDVKFVDMAETLKNIQDKLKGFNIPSVGNQDTDQPSAQ